VKKVEVSLEGGAGSLKWEVYLTVWDDEGCCELVKKVEVSLEEGVSSLKWAMCELGAVGISFPLGLY
jgi:hypothetical protein